MIHNDIMGFWQEKKTAIIVAVITSVVSALVLAVIDPVIIKAKHLFEKESKLVMSVPAVSDFSLRGVLLPLFDGNDTIRIITCLELRQEDYLNDINYILPFPIQICVNDNTTLYNVNYSIDEVPVAKKTSSESSGNYLVNQNRFVETFEKPKCLLHHLGRHYDTFGNHEINLLDYGILVSKSVGVVNGKIDELVLNAKIVQDGRSIQNYIIKNTYIITDDIESYDFRNKGIGELNNPEIKQIVWGDKDCPYIYFIRAKILKQNNDETELPSNYIYQVYEQSDVLYLKSNRLIVTFKPAIPLLLLCVIIAFYMLCCVGKYLNLNFVPIKTIDKNTWKQIKGIIKKDKYIFIIDLIVLFLCLLFAGWLLNIIWDTF